MLIPTPATHTSNRLRSQGQPLDCPPAEGRSSPRRGAHIWAGQQGGPRPGAPGESLGVAYWGELASSRLGYRHTRSARLPGAWPVADAITDALRLGPRNGARNLPPRRTEPRRAGPKAAAAGFSSAEVSLAPTIEPRRAACSSRSGLAVNYSFYSPHAKSAPGCL